MDASHAPARRPGGKPSPTRSPRAAPQATGPSSTPGAKSKGAAGGKPPRPNATPKKPFDKDAWRRRGLGSRVAVIEARALAAGPVPVSSGAGFADVCSYSWAKAPKPTIYVPGAPPTWTPPPALPVALAPDAGTFYIDQNGARQPSCPCAPLFAALHAAATRNPPGAASFSFRDVDLLANRNSLRKLLRLAAGRPDESFRIDAYLVGGSSSSSRHDESRGSSSGDGTLMLVRRERHARETIGKRSVRHGVSFGHAFEAAFGTPAPGLEGAASHHRAVWYRLGGLRCVVQFEADACVDSGAAVADEDEAGEVERGRGGVDGLGGEVEEERGAEGEQGVEGEQEVDEEDEADEEQGVEEHSAAVSDGLARAGGRGKGKEDPAESAAEQLAGLSIGDAAATSGAPQQRWTLRGRTPHENLVVIQHGNGCSQSSAEQLAELKVRSRQPYQTSNALMQLWFGRTPYLISGVHNEGVFRSVKVLHVRSHLTRWEERNQDALRKLVALITQLREILVAQRALGSGSEEGGWALICNHKVKPARLEVYQLAAKAEKRVVVPEEFVKEFWSEA